MLDSIFLFSYNEQVSHKLWPHGQSVKTSPFHGGVRGSTPLEATRKMCGVNMLRFFVTYSTEKSRTTSLGLPKITRFLGRGTNKRMGTSLSKLCMSDVCDDVLSKIARICLLIV